VLLTSLFLFVLTVCCSIFIHCAAAVPAYHLRRPVKAILDRDEDMQMTGALRLCSQDHRANCNCCIVRPEP
jgi:hypothetical protein